MATTPTIAFPPNLLEFDASQRGLRLVVAERTGLGSPQAIAGISNARELISAQGDGVFEIYWDLVVCFAVREEAFPSDGPWNTTIAESLADSAFLTWVRQTSRAEPDYVAAMSGQIDRPPLALRHWQVCCLDQLFDVASPDAPVVQRLGDAAP